MIKQKLGKIKQINLKDVFEKEDKDFTPWLNKNLDILGGVEARRSAEGGASRLKLRLPSPNGIYFIRVVSDSGIRKFKVLKMVS